MPLHALLIAIDTYHPATKIPALQGCVNDALAIQTYLKSQFPESDQNVALLLNEQATYENIISHFAQKHLAKAKKGDTVFIHFSGHGARGFSAPEFKAYYPDGLDENLVCYDSRLPGKYDLADKELAVLIEQIAIKEVDVIVLLDCCHSGSGTRSGEKLTIADSRQWEDREDVRPLKSYLNGHYTKGLYIPNAKHLLLAACEKRQKAYELSNNQGVFTTNLLQILKERKGNISYADLFSETRILMRQISRDQTPQFEAYGYFNVHRHFLKTAENSSPTYALSHQKNQWSIEAGALQGLGTSPDEKAMFEIYENGKKVANAISKVVQLNACSVDVAPRLNESKIYQAKLISIPKPPIAVAVSGIKPEELKAMLEDGDSDIKNTEIGALHKALQKHKPLYFELTTEYPDASYQLNIDSKGLQLQRNSDQLLLAKSPDKDVFAYSTIFDKLEHICKFEKTRNLGRGSMMENSDVKLLLKTIDDKDDDLETKDSGFVTVKLQKEDNWIKKIKFKVEARNDAAGSKHLALLYFTQNYGVKAIYNEEVPANTSVIMMEKNDRSKAYSFELKKKTKAKEYFKLIVSNQKIDSHLLAQDDLKLEVLRGAAKRKSKGTTGMEHWYAIDMEVDLVVS